MCASFSLTIFIKLIFYCIFREQSGQRTHTHSRISLILVMRSQRPRAASRHSDMWLCCGERLQHSMSLHTCNTAFRREASSSDFHVAHSHDHAHTQSRDTYSHRVGDGIRRHNETNYITNFRCDNFSVLVCGDGPCLWCARVCVSELWRDLPLVNKVH